MIADREVNDATCLACGCLCDDITLVASGGRVVEASRACPIGRSWFLAPRPGEGHPRASVEGRAVEVDEAVDRASAILRAARSPAVWGLSGSTVEGVASALAIADAVGAVVDLAGSDEALDRAYQRVGAVSATLGEVKARADVVVFWGVDPIRTYPRHWERYSVEPRGRFVPEGRSGRFVIAVDSARNRTAEMADLFVPIDPDRRAEALGVLRALVRSIAIDPDRAARSTGVESSTLRTLADRLKSARYGAFFHGAFPDPRAAEAALTLVRDLNDGRRFVAIGMGGPGNLAGASAVLGWQAGSPSGVDFSAGYPRYLPGDASLAHRLEAGEVDAALIVADEPPAGWADRLSKIPTVVIAPGSTAPGRAWTVAVDVARPAIEAGGTVMRVDGVMLPLRPAIDPGLPTGREVLDAIQSRIHRENV